MSATRKRKKNRQSSYRCSNNCYESERRSNAGKNARDGAGENLFRDIMIKLIADNLRITKPEIREALKSRDPRPVQELVKRCAAQGPFALDVNTGPLGKNPEADMRFFIEAAESVTDMPLLKVVRTLPEVLGFPIRTMGGISNLCTGAGDKAKRRLLEQSYVAMLASAGLDFALMDILDTDLVQSAKVSGLLAKEEIFSWAMVPGPCEPLPPCTKSTLINPNSKKG
jgi:hypothetical protein